MNRIISTAELGALVFVVANGLLAQRRVPGTAHLHTATKIIAILAAENALSVSINMGTSIDPPGLETLYFLAEAIATEVGGDTAKLASATRGSLRGQGKASLRTSESRTSRCPAPRASPLSPWSTRC
jgi:hypothetical protein